MMMIHCSLGTLSVGRVLFLLSHSLTTRAKVYERYCIERGNLFGQPNTNLLAFYPKEKRGKRKIRVNIHLQSAFEKIR